MASTKRHNSIKLEKTWRKAASLYWKRSKAGRAKKSVFYGSAMKIFMDIVKSDPKLRDEFIREYGYDPASGSPALSSSIDPTVANREFPVSLGITSKQSLEGLR